MSETIRKEFDTRVLEFHLRQGNISHEEYQEHLEALPDESKEAVETSVRFDNPFERRYHEGDEG